MAAQADVITLKNGANQSPIILADTSGEGGEGGGEGVDSSVTIYALESTDADAFKYNAKPQIDAYIDLVVTSYKKAADDAKLLAQAVDAFLAVPSDDSLKAARKAWVEARPSYLRTETFRFYDGPIDEVEGAINAWPMNEAHIDYVDGKPDAGLINDASFKVGIEEIEKSNQSKDEADVTTGWHAIEFLLWGQDLSTDGPGNRPFTDYVAGTGNNDRRREYLKLVTDELAHELHELEGTWQLQNASGYAKKLKAMPEREVIGRMVNGMAVLAGFEFMSERLAVALDSGDQEDEHSCFSDTTKQDFVYDLAGIKQVWTGDDEGTERSGLNDLMRSQDAALTDRIDGLLSDAETKVAALGDPWDQVLAKPKDSPERKAAEDVVTALQALGTGLKDAGSKLGVLVLIPTE
jgi:putative iron-regulated protein